jgi:hypothetical protein
MVPTIKVGEPLGGAALMTAEYDVTDGSFEIPYTLREAPHRIVYRLPGETVDHEVQWSITGAVLVVPRTTRYNAPVVPTGGSFSITPTGLGGSLTLPAIYTTGVFSFDDRVPKFQTSGATHVYNFDANARPLTSPIGAPVGSLGDYVMLADWTPQGGSQLSIGGFAVTHIDLMAGASTPATQPAWNSASGAYSRQLTTSACGADCIPTIDSGNTPTRFDALGVLTGATKTKSMKYGISPTTKLPGFVGGVAPDYVDNPMILPFLTSDAIDTMLTLTDPTKPGSPLLPFERVLSARFTASRVVDGATLTSAIQAITNVFTGQLQLKAPLALQIKLATNDLAAADGIMINASSQPTALTWIDEGGGAADDYVVTLFEITNNRLAPVIIYHVLTQSVSVDGSLLNPARTYVFSITSRSGLSKAKQGNYGADTVTFPFCETTTFSAAFRVQ